MKAERPRLYMNAAARRLMAQAFGIVGEMSASGRTDLVGEICACGYEGIAERPHDCPLEDRDA